MKLLTLFFSLILLISCNQKEKTKKMDSLPFFVGTYTNRESKGIYRYTISDKGIFSKIGLVAKSENPSFLTKTDDQKYLLAVNEIDSSGTGTVSSYRIQENNLEFLSKSISGGAHPCHISVNQDGDILVANYTGGNVGLLKINNEGQLSELLNIQQHEGKGTTERQQSPHAHSSWFEPNSKNIITADLGTNELWFSNINTQNNTLEINNALKLKMDDGAGPRHLVFHPNKTWIYVLNELNNTVSLIEKNENGSYIKLESIATLPVNFEGENLGADIHISNDGKFLYASNRGHNSIVIFKVNSENGSLELLAHQPSKGNWPRNFALSPDNKFLIVAHEFSNNLVSFKRDKQTGLLEFTDEIEAPSPVCILF